MESLMELKCQTEYNGLRDQVLQFLISAQWIVGEAKDQGLKVTDAEVNTQFETTKKQSFPKEADFQKFLKSSGMGLDDLKFRVPVVSTLKTGSRLNATVSSWPDSAAATMARVA